MAKLLTGPRSIVYSSKFLKECATLLHNIRVNPDQNASLFYRSTDTEYYPHISDQKKMNGN